MFSRVFLCVGVVKMKVGLCTAGLWVMVACYVLVAVEVYHVYKGVFIV